MELTSPIEGLAHLATHAPRLDWRGQVAAVALGIVGALVIFVTPAFLALVAAQSHLDDARLGYVAAWDINAMAVMIGASAFLLTRCHWRWAMGAGLALIVAGNIGTAFAIGYAPLVAARIVAGAGEGIAIGFAFAALGRARNPDRAFAVYLVAGALVSAALLYSIPWLQTRLTPHTLFLCNALIAAVCGVFLIWFPNGRASEDDPFALHGGIDRTLAASALAAVFLYFLATGAVWSYSERIGLASGLSPETIARGLSLGTLAGVLGAALAGMLPSRWGRALPLLASGAISVTSFLLLRGTVPAAAFVAASALLLFGWNFAQPLLSGICAEADRCGRVVCAMGSIQTFGMGLGPAMAGAMLVTGSYTLAIWSSCAILATSLAIVTIAAGRSRRA